MTTFQRIKINSDLEREELGEIKVPVEYSERAVANYFDNKEGVVAERVSPKQYWFGWSSFASHPRIQRYISRRVDRHRKLNENGCPDLIIAKKSPELDFFKFIELKGENGGLSQSQRDWIREFGDKFSVEIWRLL